MKAWELINILEALPPDSNIDVLHISSAGQIRSYGVIRTIEDLTGSHIIVASKRQLAEDALPECGICGKKLRYKGTRREFEGKMYCHPPMMLRTCWDKAANNE